MCPVLLPKLFSDIYQHLACALTPLWLYTCCLLCLSCPSFLICLVHLPFESQLIPGILKGLAKTSQTGSDASLGLYMTRSITYILHVTSYIDPQRCATWQPCSYLSSLSLYHNFLADIYSNDLFMYWPFSLDPELLEDSA